MNEVDAFSKTLYVVAWAGCTIPLSGRSFGDYDIALRMYKAYKGEPGLRIERMTGIFVLDTMVKE